MFPLMSKPWIVMVLVLTLAVGGTVGGVVGARWFGDDAADTADGAPAAVDCDEAQGVVDDALERVAQINESEASDPSFYAALIVEQRSMVYAMDTSPSCFSLADRAGAVGLLEGIHSLLDAFTAAATGAASSPPADSSDTGE